MDDITKALAFQAIDENVRDTTARQIIRYVMECELNGFDTIRPSNQHIANKYGWSLDTTKVAISKAKRSQFITTTGRDKSRTFELNVQYLKGKMGEIRAKKPLNKKSFLLQELNEFKQEPNQLPNDLPNHLPNLQQGANNNSNSNNNNKKDCVENFCIDDSFEISEKDSSIKKDSIKVDSHPSGARQSRNINMFVKEVLITMGMTVTKTHIIDAIPSAKKALSEGKSKEDILKAAKNIKNYKGELRPTVRSPFQSTTFWMEQERKEENNERKFNF